MQRRGDGFGRSVAAKHVTLEHAAVLIPRHERKVPEHTQEVIGSAEQLSDDIINT